MITLSQTLVTQLRLGGHSRGRQMQLTVSPVPQHHDIFNITMCIVLHVVHFHGLQLTHAQLTGYHNTHIWRRTDHMQATYREIEEIQPSRPYKSEKTEGYRKLAREAGYLEFDQRAIGLARSTGDASIISIGSGESIHTKYDGAPGCTFNLGALSPSCPGPVCSVHE